MKKSDLALLLVLTGLLGCSAGDERLHRLQRDLHDGIAGLLPGKTIEVQLPPIREDERIVFINGRYIGSVCDSSDQGESVRQELDLRFGASEGRAAFVILVSKDRILESASFDEAFSFPAGARTEGGPECALIAKAGDSALRISCERSTASAPICRPLIALGG